jgi:hypothetical protein
MDRQRPSSVGVPFLAALERLFAAFEQVHDGIATLVHIALGCLASVIRDGLLKGDSPRGVWEISDKGRAALKEPK